MGTLELWSTVFGWTNWCPSAAEVCWVVLKMCLVHALLNFELMVSLEEKLSAHLSERLTFRLLAAVNIYTTCTTVTLHLEDVYINLKFKLQSEDEPVHI